MGLFRTAGRAAVVGSVLGRTQRRQQKRFAAEDAAEAAAAGHQLPQAPVPVPAAPPAPAVVVDATDHMLAQLKQLGELKSAGILSDKEFQAQKARILAR